MACKKYFIGDKEVELGKKYSYNIEKDGCHYFFSGSNLTKDVAERLVSLNIFTSKEAPEELSMTAIYNILAKNMMVDNTWELCEIIGSLRLYNKYMGFNVLLKAASDFFQKQHPIETKAGISVYTVRSGDGTIAPLTVYDERLFDNIPWFQSKDDAICALNVLKDDFNCLFGKDGKK